MTDGPENAEQGSPPPRITFTGETVATDGDWVTIRWSPSARPGPWWIEKHKSGPKGNSPWNSLASGGLGAPMYQVGGTITWKILKSQVGGARAFINGGAKWANDEMEKPST